MPLHSDTDTLPQWLDRQYRLAVGYMLRSVSPTAIIKRRTGFDQTVRPRRGSVVASPELADFNPEPDYFFHWYRDSALVIDALRFVKTDEPVRHFSDFVTFSLSLENAAKITDIPDDMRVAPALWQFVRPPGDFTHVDVRKESRVNPDGSLDILRWNRPQFDGIAARALTVMRWRRERECPPEIDEAIASLLQADLSFVLAHWRDMSFDIWEEEQAYHYYTLRLQSAALESGAAWLRERGDERQATVAEQDAKEILDSLDGYWQSEEGYYRSRVAADGSRNPKDLDIAVVLAAIHAGGAGRHSPGDSRMESTLNRLDTIFDTDYRINRARPADRGPALGRFRGDTYYAGGAYFFSTLAAAEFCFLRANILKADDPNTATRLAQRGEAYLETVRAYIPASGEMAEQFDQRTGAQVSAKHLAWSYAAFITAVEARRSLNL